MAVIAPLHAQTPPTGEKQPTVRTVTRVYDGVVMFTFPQNFTPVFEKDLGTHYIQEAVLNGESVRNWTQMLTLTGDKDLSSRPNLNPGKFAEIKAAAYRDVCPSSFSAKVLSQDAIDGRAAIVVVTSCGKSSTSYGRTSETAVMAIIRGEKDYYTVQWAEQGPVSDTPLAIDADRWMARFNSLLPIRICEALEGEARPYPSCINRK